MHLRVDVVRDGSRLPGDTTVRLHARQAGSGARIAVLNMHGRDLGAMGPLICAIWSVYRPSGTLGFPEMPADRGGPLDPGGQELVAGLTQALAVRDVIQKAIRVLRARAGCTAHEEYLRLVQRAATAGMSLPHTAAREIASEL